MQWRAEIITPYINFLQLRKSSSLNASSQCLYNYLLLLRLQLLTFSLLRLVCTCSINRCSTLLISFPLRSSSSRPGSRWTRCRKFGNALIMSLMERSTGFFKRNATFLNPFFPVALGHWPLPRVMYILSNGSESNLQKTLLRYSSPVSCNPNLFEYMSFWAHDKTAQIPLQTMQTWYFFQMMHFSWSRVHGIESLATFLFLHTLRRNWLTGPYM